ncbi:MAG: bleomycin resistance protein [Candidatus Latescibacteria bacterium]|nr:bleomycin resistance protein [Candidatus Latescibacterota bacterium]
MALGDLRHLMLYVKDIEASRPFYQAVLGYMGYGLAHGSENYAMWVPQGGVFGLGIVSANADLASLRHQRGAPGFHHLAFNASSREEVDGLYEILQDLGATVLDPPGPCPEYSPTYYAIYFEDPDGMKLELAHS